MWGQWLAAYFTAGGQMPDLAALDARIAPQTRNAVAGRQGTVAVIPVRGVITPKPSMWEQYGLTTSVASVVNATRAAVADPNIKAVVLEYDSPGGSTAGLSGGHAELMALRGTKPIIAQVDHLAASAAYWLASAADEIAISPGGLAGSVGVYSMHMDQSEAMAKLGVKAEFIHAGSDKVLANGFEPLSDAGRAYMQGLVDAAYAAFTSDVAAGRGVDVSRVRGDAYGNGRVLTADAARAAGVVDVTRSMAQTLAAYGAQPTASGDRQRRAMALRLIELGE